MAFNSNDGRQQFIATGGQTIFAFNFCIFATSDIKVYKTLAGATPDDALDILILSTNYTVTINGTSGGNVTLLAGSSLNDTITIVRDLPITRTTDYQNNGDLFADTLDSDQDYQTYLIKDRQNYLSRALLLPSTVPSSVSVVLPNPVGDGYFKWNASGTALENDTTIPTAVVTATAQAGIATAKASEALGYRNEAEVFRNDAEAFALSIDPADIVHKSGNETIADIKTFTSSPIVPTPATDMQSATKKYVDDNKSIAVPVRQTILKGNVDTSGFSAFGGSTGSTTVTTSSTLVATCADGTSDRIGTIVNPSWTGLSTNGTMYLYLDIATNGTCTTGSTTLAPTYRWGGADTITNLQNTFNIQEMKMKVGNGTTASQVYRVFIGEVTVAGAVVTAIAWYALMGRYQGVFINTLPSATTAISLNHNIGISPDSFQFEIKCITADVGYSVGDVVRFLNAQMGSYNYPFTNWATNKTCGFTMPSTQLGLVGKSGGAIQAPTLASWAYRMTAQRGW